jgi:hypothetical protein
VAAAAAAAPMHMTAKIARNHKLQTVLGGTQLACITGIRMCPFTIQQRTKKQILTHHGCKASTTAAVYN